MTLYGVCRVMAGVALVCETSFLRSLRLASCHVLSAAPASAIFVKARKWFVFASRKKNASAFFLFLSFINNNNIYIDMDIDIGYLRLSLGYLLPCFRLSVGYVSVM